MIQIILSMDEDIQLKNKYRTSRMNLVKREKMMEVVWQVSPYFQTKNREETRLDFCALTDCTLYMW
jgi:hypothetical protein